MKNMIILSWDFFVFCFLADSFHAECKNEFKFRLWNPDYLKNISFVQEKLDWLIDISPVLSFIVVCFGLKHHTPDGANTSVQHAACCRGVTTELLQKHLRYISSNSSTQCFFFKISFVLGNADFAFDHWLKKTDLPFFCNTN